MLASSAMQPRILVVRMLVLAAVWFLQMDHAMLVTTAPRVPI
jgi:hypothetical protein